ncbi:MAG: YidB family protein [Bacteroidota bacterium]
MGILDSIVGQFSGKENAQSPLLNAVMNLVGNQQSGGLQGLVEQLSSKGLGDIVNSWVSTGKNLPVTADQLKQGLGAGTIGKIASEAGISTDQVSSQLASLLPQIVDKLTPNGKVSQDDIVAKGMDLLKGLMK